MKNKIWFIFLAVIILAVMMLSLGNIINDTLGMSIAFLLFIIFSFSVFYSAHKNNVKIVEYLMIIFMVISTVLLVFSVKAYLKVGIQENYPFRVLVTEDDSVKKLLFSDSEHRYYSYNLNSIEIKFNNETLSLEDAFERNIVSLDKMLDLAIPNQGPVGYKIYYDGGSSKESSDKYSIIVCDNSDVIFSSFDYIYEDSMCK